MLRAGVILRGRQAQRTGTPQGGVVSPLLANVFAPAGPGMGGAGPGCVGALRRRPRGGALPEPGGSGAGSGPAARPARRARSGAQGGEDAHRAPDGGGEGLDFLGFEHRWVPTKRRRHVQFLARWPSRRAMQRARDRIRELTARSRLLLSPTRVVAEVNRFLRGWASYFCYGNSAQALHALHWYAGQRLTIWWGKRQGWRRRHLTNPVPLANHLGLLSLGGHVVAPRPNRPWQGVPHASR